MTSFRGVLYRRHQKWVLERMNQCNYSTCFSRLQNDYIKLKSCPYCTYERMKDVKCNECNYSTCFSSFEFELFTHMALMNRLDMLSQLIVGVFCSDLNHLRALIEEKMLHWSHVVLGNFLTWLNGLICGRGSRQPRLFVVPWLHTRKYRLCVGGRRGEGELSDQHHLEHGHGGMRSSFAMGRRWRPRRWSFTL